MKALECLFTMTKLIVYQDWPIGLNHLFSFPSRGSRPTNHNAQTQICHGAEFKNRVSETVIG